MSVSVQVNLANSSEARNSSADEKPRVSYPSDPTKDTSISRTALSSSITEIMSVPPVVFPSSGTHELISVSFQARPTPELPFSAPCSSVRPPYEPDPQVSGLPSCASPHHGAF